MNKRIIIIEVLILLFSVFYFSSCGTQSHTGCHKTQGMVGY